MYKNRTILALHKAADRYGFRTHEYDPFTAHNGRTSIQVDVSGHGELLEAYFIRQPATGFWRWARGYRHVNTHVDKISSLTEFYAQMRMFSEGVN